MATSTTCFALLFLPILPIASAMLHSQQPHFNSTDMECLMAFKSSVMDPYGYLLSWTLQESEICSFNGVQCWDDRSTKILSLKLDEVGLSGAFPAGLSYCTSLTSLSLSGNHFTGPLPPDLCHQLPFLTGLILSANAFSGDVPSDLANCRYLNKLHLDNNFLSGAVPGSLGTLPLLTDLDLSSNLLSGSIPSSFTNYRLSIDQEPFPASAFGNNEHLCGPPLETECKHALHLKPEIVRIIAGGAVLLFVVMASFLGLRIGAARCPACSSKRRSATYVEMFDSHLRLTWQNLQQATSSFSATNVIGVGGSSTVYKGKLSGYGKLIAIKVLQGDGVTDQLELVSVPDIRRQFLTELEVLGKLRHRNLLRILGYCYNLDTMAIILDFMSMGSLDVLLHGKKPPSHGSAGVHAGRSQRTSTPAPCSLNWEARLGILVGIAQGLAYLHIEYDAKRSVVHGDLKPSNVLLDEYMEVHIADFGLARMVGAINTGSTVSASRQYIALGVRGWSLGYTAPECGQQGMVSRKSDVFSFGVTVLEVLTGERPNSSRLEEGETLADWVGKAISKGMGHRVIAPALIQGSDWERWEHDITAALKMGCRCASFTAAARPDMHEVTALLQDLIAHKAYIFTARASTNHALQIIDHTRD